MWMCDACFVAVPGGYRTPTAPAVPPTFQEHIMNANDKQHSIDVDVPVRVAYDQWTQFEAFPMFMDGVSSVSQLDDDHLHWIVDIAGVTREFDTTITEQIPDERVAWTTSSGPSHAGVVTFHTIDDNTTRVTLQMDFEPEGFLETVGDKLGFVNSRLAGDMKNFKSFIEDRSEPSVEWRGTIEHN
jgi:uncharacterized membrane protein